MTFNNGKQQMGPLAVSGPSQTITFTTTATTVRLENCAHTGFAGGVARYYQWGWNPLPNTDGSGNTSIELLPGSYYFDMDYHFGHQQIGPLPFRVNTYAATFTTTSVTIGGTGTKEYYQNSWHAFPTIPYDLLPGSYYFRVDGNQVGPFAVSGCSYAVPYDVTVKTSAGVGIPNTTVKYNNDGGGIWSNAITNSNGVAKIPGGNNYVNVILSDYKGSTGWVNTAGDNITFYTTKIIAKVVISGGAGIPGASVDFSRTNFSNYNHLVVNGSGEASEEHFPGFWYLRAWQGIVPYMSQIITVTVGGSCTTPGQNSTTTFTTTKVTVPGATSASVSVSPTGIYNYFEPFNPNTGIELLPGTWYFMINGASTNYLYSGVPVKSYAISGCSYALPHDVTVKTSAGIGIPSVTVQYNNDGGGTWLNSITDGNGVATIPSGNNYVKVNYNLGSTGWVNTFAADITFYTTTVTAVVKSCTTGNGIAGAYVNFHPGPALGGTWLFGDNGAGASTHEVFAGTWTFGANYYGMVQNVKTEVVGGNNTTAGQTFTTNFLTTLVTGGTGSVYCDPSHDGLYNYYRLGPFTPDAGIELLPGAYYFKNNSTSAHFQNGTIVGPFDISGCQYGLVELKVTEPVTFIVYPNPASDKITIKFTSTNDGQAFVKLADLSGKVIIDRVIGSFEGPNVHDVNLGNLPNGMYVLKFNNGYNNEVRKITVQH